MDTLSRQFYRLRFLELFRKKHEQEFQDFFASIMKARHGSDFHRVQPWGNVGDLKNDGYLASEKTLFQVYAPHGMVAANTIAKMEEDFEGARENWREHFDTWVFVHNEYEGIPAPVSKKLLELDVRYSDVSAIAWSEDELRDKVLSLDLGAMEDIFGAAPTRQHLIEMRLDEVRPILEHLEAHDPSMDAAPIPVDPAKLTKSALSADASGLIRQGLTRSEMIRDYYRGQADPMVRDRHAKLFRREYEALRAKGRSPDQILSELQDFVGGPYRGSPRLEAAVVAVLAYYFESCDIFDPVEPGEAAT